MTLVKHKKLIRYLNKMGNQELSDIHSIDEKRSFVDKYTGYADQLEQLHLIHIWINKKQDLTHYYKILSFS